MNIANFDFSSIAWLVATQFLLYAAGWVLCGLLLPEQRAAVTHWGAFMLLIGLGFVLSGQRVEPRTWGPYVGSNVLFLVGYVVLRRGLESFLHLPPRDREHAATLLVLLGGCVLAGPDEAHAQWRVLLAYGGGAWVLLRTMIVSYGPMRAEFGARLSWALSLPALLLIAGFSLRSAEQLLHFDHGLEMHRLTQVNSRLLFGYLIGAALFNFSFMGLLITRLVGRLRRQTQQDTLTGLMNRRALEARLQSEWQRVQRGGPGFAVLALDLDHFKRVNDEHGHLAGDAVLAQLAQRLRQVLREVDAVARTGGEEFVVLVPHATMEGAARAAERLRHSVAAVPFDLPAGPTPVTVSVGVVMARREDGELRHLLLRADRALYAAKAAGRNCVHLGAAGARPDEVRT